jgi:hypothetical protein
MRNGVRLGEEAMDRECCGRRDRASLYSGRISVVDMWSEGIVMERRE